MRVYEELWSCPVDDDMTRQRDGSARRWALGGSARRPRGKTRAVETPRSFGLLYRAYCGLQVIVLPGRMRSFCRYSTCKDLNNPYRFRLRTAYPSSDSTRDSLQNAILLHFEALGAAKNSLAGGSSRWWSPPINQKDESSRP